MKAFPNEGFNGWGEPEQGMDLRDWFAAKAMQGFIADGAAPEVSKTTIAAMAYAMADAMLEAREL